MFTSSSAALFIFTLHFSASHFFTFTVHAKQSTTHRAKQASIFIRFQQTALQQAVATKQVRASRRTTSQMERQQSEVETPPCQPIRVPTAAGDPVPADPDGDATDFMSVSRSPPKSQSSGNSIVDPCFYVLILVIEHIRCWSL